MSPQALTLTAIAILMALIALGFLIDAFQRGWNEAKAEHQRKQRQIQAELDALRSAGRINLAFWNARQEMGAEAQRWRGGGR